MEELLKNISSKDLEKLKILLSIIPKAEAKEVVTLRVFIDEYSNLIKQNRSKAYHSSVMCSFKHIIKFFGIQKSIREIGLKETESFCTYLQQKVCIGYHVYYRTLKAAFNKAKDWGYINENYFTKVKLPKKQKLAPVFINREQLSAISDEIMNEIMKDVVVFAFYTGMRLNEIVNLRWDNVDIQNKIITVGDDCFTTKGRKQRFIPICEEALRLLVEWESENHYWKRRPLPYSCISKKNLGYVFCKENGERYTGNYISKRFKNACKAAGLDDSIHFHSLRHSFASNLVQQGVPLYTIKELLGHTSISTTEIYSHLNMETLREAVGRLDSGCKILDAGKGYKDGLKIFRINGGEVK